MAGGFRGFGDTPVQPEVLPHPKAPALINVDVPAIVAKVNDWAARLPWWLWFLAGIFLPKMAVSWWRGRRASSRTDE